MTAASGAARSAAHIVVVRHGQTVWNRESRVQGYLDSALTDEGVAQARAIAQRLAGESFGALLSSDLGRAVHTAQLIAEQTGHALRTDARLRERNYGALEGLTREELRKVDPEAAAAHESRDPDHALSGGESQRAFVRRIAAAFDSLADEYAGKRIVVVSHGGVLAGFYRHVSGIDIAAPRSLVLPNASYNVFVREGGRWSAPVWGDTAHLEEQECSGEV